MPIEDCIKAFSETDFTPAGSKSACEVFPPERAEEALHRWKPGEYDARCLGAVKSI
jgi:hypothetical protein